MKRSKAIQLLLMGIAPVTFLAGCDQDKTQVKTVTTTNNFSKIQDCVAAGKPQDVCAQSYMAALSRHKAVAPTYEKKEDCDADFMADYCVPTENGKFMPKMAGFSLATETRQVVDRSTGAPVVTQNTDSNGFITGMLLGNLMSGNGGTVYRSDPYYSRRDASGAQTDNTMSGFASNGFRPSRSIEEKARAYSNSRAEPIRSNQRSSSRYDDDDDDNSYYGRTSSSNYNRPATSPSGSYTRPSSDYSDTSRSQYGRSSVNSDTSTRSTYGSGSSTKSASTYSTPSRSSYDSGSSISVSRAVTRGGFGATSSAKSSFGSSFGG